MRILITSKQSFKTVMFAVLFVMTSTGESQILINVTDTNTISTNTTLITGNDLVAVMISPDDTNNTIDFGYRLNDTSMGDLVWNDRNSNGLQDTGEPGIAGVMVYLDENSNGLFDAGEPNDTTDALGSYEITAVAVGNYTVRVDSSTIPEGYIHNLVSGSDFFNVTLTADEDFNGADFAMISSIRYGINDISQNEGDTGTTPFVFDVTLNQAASFVVTVEYVAFAMTATSGNDFVVSSGTLTFNPSETMQTITIDVIGDEVFEGDQTFGIDFFDPVDATSNPNDPGTGVGTIVNDDAQPAISVNDTSVIEGDISSTVTMNFDVTLSGQSELPISVEYVTNEADATADVDYATTGGIVNFAALTTTQVIDIAVTGDDTDESNETFTVDLSNPMNVNIADDSGIGTIIDDDGKPSVSINDANVIEGDDGNRQVELTISLSNETSGIVEVNYETVAATAESDVDFVAVSGSISIPAKQLSGTITVDIISDYAIEQDEQFSVMLTSSTNATINDGVGIVTITDDDEGADLSIDLNVTPQNPQMSDILTYAVTITNNGPEIAIDTIATLNLFDRMTFIDATSNLAVCNENAGLVECQMGDLSNGQTVEITLTAQVTTLGTIAAEAGVSSTTSDDANPSNNHATFGSQTSAIMVPVLSIYALTALFLLMLVTVKRKPFI